MPSTPVPTRSAPSPSGSTWSGAGPRRATGFSTSSTTSAVRQVSRRRIRPPGSPCRIALVVISCATRRMTTWRAGSTGRRAPRTSCARSTPAARTCATTASRSSGPSSASAVLVPLSTSRTSASERRAVSAMVAETPRIRSSSSRNCTESACAMITASECPTMSCTSRAMLARSVSACARSTAFTAVSSAWTRRRDSAVRERITRTTRPVSHARRRARTGAAAKITPPGPPGCVRTEKRAPVCRR